MHKPTDRSIGTDPILEMDTDCAICKTPLRPTSRVRLQGSCLVKCSACESWTYLPRPDADAQAAIHDDAEYFDHPYLQHRRSVQNRIDRRCRLILSQIATGLKLSSLQGQSLLDVGCDTGVFLASAARQYGIQPIGVDVSARAVEVAKQQGIQAYHTALEQAPTELSNLAVITAIDLIEHVADPHSLLKAIFSRLRPGGVAYLETPNIQSSVYQVGRWLSNLTGGYPTAICERLFPPQHIQYFTCTSFQQLAQNCGFEVLRLKPRLLPFEDLATSLPIRLGLMPLQLFDKLTGNEILICALLQKPL